PKRSFFTPSRPIARPAASHVPPGCGEVCSSALIAGTQAARCGVRQPADGRHRMTTRLQLWTALLIGFVFAFPANAGTFEVLRSDEATIADIQAALKAKTLTCRALVQMYLDRIGAYDKKGPALNAVVVINPDALQVADTLDAKFAQSGPVG